MPSSLRRPFLFVVAAVLAVIGWFALSPRTASRADTHVSFTETIAPRASRDASSDSGGSRGVARGAVEDEHVVADKKPSPSRKHVVADDETSPSKHDDAAPPSRKHVVADDEPSPPTRVAETRPSRKHVVVDDESQVERAPSDDDASTSNDSGDAPVAKGGVSNPWAPSGDTPAAPPAARVRNPWAPAGEAARPSASQPPPKKTAPKHPPRGQKASSHTRDVASEAGPRTTSLELLGVLAGRNGKTALVRIGSDVHFVHVGSRLAGWTVVAFNCRPPYNSDIVVRKADVSRRLPLIPITAAAGLPQTSVPAAGASRAPSPKGVAHGAPPKKGQGKVRVSDDHSSNPLPNELPPNEPPVDPRDFNP